MEGLSYWEQLKNLKLYSLERRRERYQIIYTWRVIEGQVPNFDSTPIRTTLNDRRGRSCLIPNIVLSAPKRIQSIRFTSLPFKGPRLFNCLPKGIRDLKCCEVSVFKKALDRCLSTLPDQPLIPNMTHLKICETNSIVDRIKRCQHSMSPTRPLIHLQDSCDATAC